MNKAFTFKSFKRCFIIAEISANHGGKIGDAIKMIKEAKKAGADAVKFQTYTPDTLTIDSSKRYFQIKHHKWGGQSLYDLYKKAYTPWDWFPKLKKVAESEGLIFFSTAFDKSAVDFLESLNVGLHKIASFECVDIPLIQYMASKKKPMIISTGMATLSEIKEAIKAAKEGGAPELVVLKCVSCYPADPKEMNISTISDMAKKFKTRVGLSDHTMGHIVAAGAVALGATVIEKHFTLSRMTETADSFFSMEPQEFKALVDNVRLLEDAIGQVTYGLTAKQKASRVFRRSLFVTEDILQGEKITEQNVRSIRPAHGMAPKFLKKIIGKKAKKKLTRGTPLKSELID